MITQRTHRTLTPLLLAASLLVTACDDTTDPEPEPEIETLRLTIGTSAAQTINIGTNPGCSVSPGPITIPINTTVTVIGAFLNAGGTPDPIANDPAVFRMSGDAGAEIAPTPASVVWTRTGPFAGTLRGSAATMTGSMELAAFHIEEGHEDWGPCTVPITVTP